MASMRDIKRRKSSVQSTQQITPFDVSHGSHKKTPFLSEDISEISS